MCAQIEAECNAVRSRVGLVDQSSGGKLYLLGPDAERAAHWLFSAHIPADAGTRGPSKFNFTVTVVDSMSVVIFCINLVLYSYVTGVHLQQEYIL